jgi:hypothetical protein
MRERSLIGGDGDQSRDGSIYADYWQIDLIRICIKCIRCGDVAAQDESPSRCSAQIVTVMFYAGFTTLRRHVKNENTYIRYEIITLAIWTAAQCWL